MEIKTRILCSLLTITLFGLILTGCDRQQDRSSSENSSVPEMNAMVKFGSPAQSELSKPSTREFSNEATSFFNAAKSASTVKEADRKVRKILADSSSIDRPFREQMAAFAMFANHFAGEETDAVDLTEKKLKILGFYTDLFVENRSPEAAYILPALKALRGKWPDQKVAKSAQTVAQAARSTYSSSKSSESVSVQKLKRETGRSGHAGEVLKAATELTQLSMTLNKASNDR